MTKSLASTERVVFRWLQVVMAVAAFVLAVPIADVIADHETEREGDEGPFLPVLRPHSSRT